MQGQPSERAWWVVFGQETSMLNPQRERKGGLLLGNISAWKCE